MVSCPEKLSPVPHGSSTNVEHAPACILKIRKRRLALQPIDLIGGALI